MFAGSLGTPPGGWPKKLQRIILRGEEPHEGRPGANLQPVDFQAAQAALEKQVEHSVHLDELLTSLLYPEVFAQYDRFRRTYSDVSVLPTPAFFYGLKPGDEITAEIESGKALIIKFLAVGDSRPDGTRLLFFELNGQPREVTVRDRALRVAARAHPKADPADPGQVAAPTPGLISGESIGCARREVDDARSDEDAIQYLRADRGARGENSDLDRATGRSQGPSTYDRSLR